MSFIWNHYNHKKKKIHSSICGDQKDQRVVGRDKARELTAVVETAWGDGLWGAG